jgi:hypothetical protein
MMFRVGSARRPPLAAARAELCEGPGAGLAFSPCFKFQSAALALDFKGVNRGWGWLSHAPHMAGPAGRNPCRIRVGGGLQHRPLPAAADTARARPVRVLAATSAPLGGVLASAMLQPWPGQVVQQALQARPLRTFSAHRVRCS